MQNAIWRALPGIFSLNTLPVLELLPATTAHCACVSASQPFDGPMEDRVQKSPIAEKCGVIALM